MVAGLESGHHGAAVNRGVPGVVHGMRSLFLQDEEGQVLEASSISAGLDYPGVGPEHAMLAEQGRARYEVATDAEALAGFQLLSATEGIVPALEPAHAIGWLQREAGRSVPAGSDGAGDALGPRRQGRRAGRGDARGARLTLEARLRERRDAGRKLLVPYVTGGLGARGATSCAPSPARRRRDRDRHPVLRPDHGRQDDPGGEPAGARPGRHR